MRRLLSPAASAALPMRFFLFALHLASALLICLMLFQACPARAQIDDLEWQDVEAVDTGDVHVPDGSGTSVHFWDGAWRVVYLKSGEVWFCSRGEEGWEPALQLSSSQGTASHPRIASTLDALHVVWEDSRSGIAQIWGRQLNGEVWSADENLSPGTEPARAPVIAGIEETGTAFLAWEEEGPSGFLIQGRYWTEDAWGDPFLVSDSPGDARSPSLDGARLPWLFAVCWIDTRNGGSDVYLRWPFGPGVDPEPSFRLTDLDGECSNPSLQLEVCCWDYGHLQAEVVFENEAFGEHLVWAALRYYWDPEIYAFPLSEIGVVNEWPSVAGYEFPESDCWTGGFNSRYFAAWTEEDAGGRVHKLAYLEYGHDVGQRETISTQGIGAVAVGARGGRPDASLMTLWVEDQAGVPTLLSRRGSIPGCRVEQVDGPPALLLGPQGEPANVMRVTNSCTGEPYDYYWLHMEFDPALDAALTWDAGQEHPVLPGLMIDDNGEAEFAIWGGGCSQDGSVRVYCVEGGGPTVAGWSGAKSPDVNGDCLVGTDDLEYIQSVFGTDDFCGDLDGSGLVDVSDLAIVMETMGDQCPAAGVPDEDPIGGARPEEMAAFCRAYPNPCRGQSTLSFRLPGVRTAGLAEVMIADISGRVIRRLPAQVTGSGSGTAEWDGRDEEGRAAPSGVYQVLVRSDATQAWGTLLVLR